MARPIVIYTDSAADLTPRELAGWRVGLVPMALAFGSESFLDDQSVSMARLWERLEAGEALSTSQPSLQTFLDLFERARDQDWDLLYIALSSNLSGTYQTARAATTMVDYDGISIVDGRQAAASMAEKLLVWRACQLRDAGGMAAADIAAALVEFRDRVRLFACIDSLDYLVRGGRLSKLAGNVGSLLSIKPIITFSPDGNVAVVKKVPGLKRATAELCDMVKAHRADPAYPVIPVFARDPANCLAFLDQLKTRLGLTTVTPPQEIGATIGCHIGPGGFGLSYVAARG